MLGYLLSRGASNFDQQNFCGLTALCFVSELKDEDLKLRFAQLLISKMNPEAINFQTTETFPKVRAGTTALHWASKHKAVNVSELLLSKGADACLEDEQQVPAFQLTTSFRRSVFGVKFNSKPQVVECESNENEDYDVI
ncbi:hypothetical protein SOPP22_16225 [Shewanella sp. OPT22]|nr:hypothetical protein SOPP22_16225 [Shewanella sp. OPT22]